MLCLVRIEAQQHRKTVLCFAIIIRVHPDSFNTAVLCYIATATAIQNKIQFRLYTEKYNEIML